MAQKIALQEQEYLLDEAEIDPRDRMVDELLRQKEYEAVDYEDLHASPSPFMTAGRVILVTLAIAWIAFAGYLFYRRGLTLPSIDQIPHVAMLLSVPLVLIAILYQLLLRSSLGEADRFSRIAASLRKESEALDMRLAIVNQQLETARETMRDQALLLEQYGASASINLESSAKTMAEHASTSAQQAELIERAGLSLAHQFGQLIDVLPAVEERATRISASLSDGSDALGDKVDRLEARLDSLVKLTEEARTRTLAATQSLTAQLMQIQDGTRSAGEQMTGMADLSANRIAVAIQQASDALSDNGTVLESQMTRLSELVVASRDAISATGTQAITGLSSTIDDVEIRVRDINSMIASQTDLMERISEELGGRIDRIGERFQRLEIDGIAGAERLIGSLDELTRRTHAVEEALKLSDRTAESIIARSEALLTALDASVRELDETHPAAIERLEERIVKARNVLAMVAPEIEQMEAVSAAIFGRAKDTEELLSGQGKKLSAWLDSGEQALAANTDQVTKLHDVIMAADADAKRLIDSSGPQLVATLLRVKEVAEQAGERARQALAKAVTEATSEMGDVSEKSLSERLGGMFQARIGEISTVADEAVRAAHTASDRLMRQLLTIADTTASIEKRISEAEDAAEKREQDNFSRRSSTLIEALNSVAIDVTKILSSDVGDSSWAAYLKGDRGVFTRRAVRLLDSEDERSIGDLYDDNEAFRDNVNRYIHDFEAMLRNVLATREGSSLGVTLLSSDIGKLYVLLAQAIDRLK
jgi:hypothetical protein